MSYRNKTANFKDERTCIICGEIETTWDDMICTFCTDMCPDHIPVSQIGRWLLKNKKAGKIEIHK